MHTLKVLIPAIAILALTGLTGCTKKNMRQTSASMEPTIKRGDMVSVDLSAYSHSSPNRWDVIVFDSPISGGGVWPGRIVGLPGESVDILAGGIVIDGKPIATPSHLSIAGYELPQKIGAPSIPGPVSFPFRIPTGCYFVLGDNVSNSLDSRYWGGLDESKIKGKVIGK
jgi:signal peptidase I